MLGCGKTEPKASADPMGPLELGWPFRDVLSWGQEVGSLHPCDDDHSLDTGCSREAWKLGRGNFLQPRASSAEGLS